MFFLTLIWLSVTKATLIFTKMHPKCITKNKLFASKNFFPPTTTGNVLQKAKQIQKFSGRLETKQSANSDLSEFPTLSIKRFVPLCSPSHCAPPSPTSHIVTSGPRFFEFGWGSDHLYGDNQLLFRGSTYDKNFFLSF